MTPHPLAAMFPMMPDDELRELADDIAANGLVEPIVVHPDLDQILDGRNRLAACTLAGVEPEFRDFEGDQSEIVPWILSKNLHRRHLTASQRAAIAAELASLPDGHRQVGQLADVPTQAEAAAMLNVGERSVRRARAVLEADPELHEQVKRGEVSVAAAAAQVRPAEPARCGQPHPVTSNPCTEPEGHAWTHSYREGTHRCWWTDAGERGPLNQPTDVGEPGVPDASATTSGPEAAEGARPPRVAEGGAVDDLGGGAGDEEARDGLGDPGAHRPPGPPVPPRPAVSADPVARPPLPNGERAQFDAYYTPSATADACVRWLRDRVIPLLPPGERTAVEPCVGAGAWVRAIHRHLNAWTVDRVDLDPEARGLELDRRRSGMHRGAVPGLGEEDAVVGSWLDPLPEFDGFGGLRRARWDLCLGNRPYSDQIGPWVETALARARCVALLERETITGTEGRLGWWRAHRPAFVAKVVPRPKWEGPGARPTADFSDTVLIVWLTGHTGPTEWDWVDAGSEA